MPSTYGPLLEYAGTVFQYAKFEMHPSLGQSLHIWTCLWKWRQQLESPTTSSSFIVTTSFLASEYPHRPCRRISTFALSTSAMPSPCQNKCNCCVLAVLDPTFIGFYGYLWFWVLREASHGEGLWCLNGLIVPSLPYHSCHHKATQSGPCMAFPKPSAWSQESSNRPP